MNFTVKVRPDPVDVVERQTRQLQQGVRRAGVEVADVGSEAILDSVRSRRGSLRFGRSSLDVRATSHASGEGFTVTLSGTPAGPWTIVNDGSKPHEIRPRRRALSFNGKAFARVNHPGTSATHVWEAAKTPLTKTVSETIEDTIGKALK